MVATGGGCFVVGFGGDGAGVLLPRPLCALVVRGVIKLNKSANTKSEVNLSFMAKLSLPNSFCDPCRNRREQKTLSHAFDMISILGRTSVLLRFVKDDDLLL